MTFAKFNELFKSKYPEGEVVQHGKFGGTEKNKKTTVIFVPGGKCYEYYGAYEDVLNRVGIKVISQSRFHDKQSCLESYKKWNGREALFGGRFDYNKEIVRLECEIKEILDNYVIV